MSLPDKSSFHALDSYYWLEFVYTSIIIRVLLRSFLSQLLCVWGHTSVWLEPNWSQIPLPILVRIRPHSSILIQEKREDDKVIKPMPCTHPSSTSLFALANAVLLRLTRPHYPSVTADASLLSAPHPATLLRQTILANKEARFARWASGATLSETSSRALDSLCRSAPKSYQRSLFCAS